MNRCASANRPPLARIEAASCARHRNEDLGWLESRRKPTVECVELANDRVRADRIDVSEWTAAEWRKADTEHGPYVAVARPTKNSFLEATCRLVDHREDTALNNLVIRNGSAFLGSASGRGCPMRAGRPDELVDRNVDRAFR